MANRKCPPHKPDGCTCLVAHYRDGVLQPACFECLHCGHWIEHDGADGPCDGCRKADNRKAGKCEQGHEFTDEQAPRGFRHCLECKAWVDYSDNMMVWIPEQHWERHYKSLLGIE